MVSNKKKFHSVVILDRSGSMDLVRDKTVSGVNEYIQTLDKDNGDMVFTLAVFNSKGSFGSNSKLDIEYLYDNQKISEVKPLTSEQYSPIGGTPLLDAIGTVITKIEGLYKGKKTKPDISVMIVTDGEENSSVEYTKEAIKKLIEDREKGNWGFAYLGANQDAWSVAGGIGIRQEASRNYSVKNIDEVFVAAALVTSDARRTNSSKVKWPGENPDSDTNK